MIRMLRIPLAIALLIAVAAFVMPPESVSKPLTIRESQLEAMRYAIFIRGDGYPAHLVNERGGRAWSALESQIGQREYLNP
jgi:hypothetical protein